MRATCHGPLIARDGVTFRLWAPAAKRVDLVVQDGEPQAMAAQAGGWRVLTVPGAGPGTLYRFRIDDELDVPDPASRFQPRDVNGPSEVADLAYDWQARDWRGRPWHETSLLELHVGAFTPEGTFRAAIERLDHVVETGFTAIELMAVADVAGARNWGYDGVLPFAPDGAYGRPEDLQVLIDAAHARGLMVFLDVVYNHFGPEGNYLGRYAPPFFVDAQTPWGAAIDYSVPEVRTFVVENALHWLRDYRFDGLRLDAVHAIVVPGELSILTEISEAVGLLAQETGRYIHLMLENDDNTAHLLDPGAEVPQGSYRAQWNDDYHHAFHVLLTGEGHGYYGDYADETGTRLARILADGFAYQGEPSPHRQGATRGEPSGDLPATAFISFLQNHDQIGNRALGDRLTVLAPAAAVEAALVVTLLGPQVPMMFMGDEWGSTQPFPFFCDFQGDLADAVRRGRRSEFEAAYAKLGNNWPDPLDPETFRSAVLDWSALGQEEHRRRLDLVRRLLHLRAREIVPRLSKLQSGAQAHWDAGLMTATWDLSDGSQLVLMANLSDAPVARPASWREGRPLWGSAPPPQLGPWSVHWSLA